MLRRVFGRGAGDGAVPMGGEHPGMVGSPLGGGVPLQSGVRALLSGCENRHLKLLLSSFPTTIP